MKKKFKTCKDLEGSLYIAPNEIRSCCKRFFFDNKMRGDAKLLTITDGKIPNSNDIKKAREKIFDEIQEDKNEDCKGCIFLKETETKPSFDSSVEYLSIEHHSVCNLRCNYCSEIYWGGKKSKYDVVEFVSSLNKSGNLNKCNQVVWGGGEPTLDKSFKNIFEEINSNANPAIYHRVFTNSVRYSEPLNDFLKKNIVKITTSIDAGTEETFKKVRGRHKLKEVFENLNRYSQNDPSKITVKYIFTAENKNEQELNEFVNNCKKYNLTECNYQISTNYKSEMLDFDVIKSIAYLFFKLSNIGIKKIFLDDHIVVKYLSLDQKKLEELKEYLRLFNADDLILNPKNFEKIIVYGAGIIGRSLISKSNFFRNIKNFKIIDENKDLIGKEIYNKTVSSPEIIKHSDEKIFIASAAHYDDIFKSIVSVKGNANNIVSGLII